jgi:small subunit ribosomal protein S12
MNFHKNKNQPRIDRGNYVHAVFLKKNPQMRGRFVRLTIITPKKPNSALRKTGKIILRTRKLAYCRILGSGSIPSKFSIILVRGGGFRDTPASNYSIIRGALECLPLFSKIRKRSLYGVTRTHLFRTYKIKVD